MCPLTIDKPMSSAVLPSVCTLPPSDSMVYISNLVCLPCAFLLCTQGMQKSWPVCVDMCCCHCVEYCCPVFQWVVCIPILLSCRLCTSCQILAMLRRQRATSCSPSWAHCHMLWVRHWLQTIVRMYYEVWTICQHMYTFLCCVYTMVASMWSLRYVYLTVLASFTTHAHTLCLYTYVPIQPVLWHSFSCFRTGTGSAEGIKQTLQTKCKCCNRLYKCIFTETAELMICVY